MKEIEEKNEDTGETTKVTYYTAEEIAAKDVEIERLNNLNNEKTENFKKVNDKTEKLEGEFGKLKETLTQKEDRERETAKVTYGAKYHANNEELKTKIEAKYSLLNMPESTAEEVAAKMEEAARMAGIVTDNRNPLFSPTYGEAPRISVKNKEDEFLKSEKGQAALKAMGFETEAPKV